MSASRGATHQGIRDSPPLAGRPGISGATVGGPPSHTRLTRHEIRQQTPLFLRAAPPPDGQGRRSPRQRFRRVVLDAFVPDLRTGRPFRPGLRIKGVRRVPGTYGLTWSMGSGPAGRATWQYGTALRLNTPHVIWRRTTSSPDPDPGRRRRSGAERGAPGSREIRPSRSCGSRAARYPVNHHIGHTVAIPGISGDRPVPCGGEFQRAPW